MKTSKLITKTKLTDQIFRLQIERETQFDTFNETIKEGMLPDIICVEENGKIVVYCLKSELKDITNDIECYFQDIEDES